MTTSRYTLTKVSDNSNGNYLYESELDITVFEDVQDAEPAYYAWNGDADQHDAAEKTATYATADEAISAAIDIYNTGLDAEAGR